MGLFGPKLEQLVSRRDVPGLWKFYVKSKRRKGGEELCDFADEAWDYAYELFLTRKAKQFDLLEFILLLEKRGKHYAGRNPVTPAEFAARFSVKGSMSEDSKGKCPACKRYLTDGKSSSPNQYLACRTCGRYYHVHCTTTRDRCLLCDGWQWRSIHRTRALKLQ